VRQIEIKSKPRDPILQERQANELILEREDLTRFVGRYKPDTFQVMFTGDRCEKCNRVYEQFVLAVHGKDAIAVRDTVSKKTVQPNEITESLLREFLQIPYNPS
jgi:hypothetical protein